MSWFRRGASRPAWTWPYTPDDRDRVVPLPEVPQSDVGAPLPVVLASERTLLLVYMIQETLPAWEGADVAGVESGDLPIAVVQFHRPYAHMLGWPNDEAFAGHPLAARGLHPYGAFVVEDSSWIRALERMNSVHPLHDPARFRPRTHYVLSFHDSTFECVAEGFSFTVRNGSLRETAAEALNHLA
ncbi:MAG TPA: hypothetical protein VFQ45_18400 [Longimicrobium sp.]|nr:hypothetical protein [Longimicrobium sp.]